MNLDDVLHACLQGANRRIRITDLPGQRHRSQDVILTELRGLRLLSEADEEPYRLRFRGYLIWLYYSDRSGWWYVNACVEEPPLTPAGPAARLPLSAEQEAVAGQVASATGGDVLVLAGPGSGKTKTLVSCIERAVRGGIPGEKIAAISFTNNSAAELKVRLCKEAADLPALHRVHVSTFHGWVSQLAALRVEPWSHPPIGLQTPSLALALHLKSPDTATHVFTVAEVNAADRHFEGCETFETMEARNFNKIGPKGSEGTNRRGFDNLVKAAGELEEEMKRCQISTFGSLMKSGIDLARGLRAGDLQWLFIDEAQDLNSTQADFVHAVQESTGCRVFVIGDDDQGIYKFRGASNQFLRDFEGKRTTTTFRLSENFRSTGAIVGASLGWIRPNWEKTGNGKTPYSSREGLPVILLTGSTPKLRGKHARIILEACKRGGLLDAWGEAAALSLSANPDSCFDLKETGLPLSSCTEGTLPDHVRNDFLTLCEERRATGEWHHALWEEFLNEIKDSQSSAGETRFGHPGLRELYASLEVIRRMAPERDSHTAARELRKATHEGKKWKILYTGSKPDPDYSGDAINLISLHSSKGMEFRVVWLIGGDFAIKEKDRDKEQGQPNVLGELGDWAKGALGLHPGSTITPDQANSLATEMENRRLLYVGMSRATDLLMMSAQAGDFQCALKTALARVPCIKISTDEEAHAFAATIAAKHRHPTWSPPHRYRVESFTSLTGQAAPGEEREQEVPGDREFPLPQSRQAMIGDLFHRIMHLLRLEPALITGRLDKTTITDAGLIARVSTRGDLHELATLLENYFSDIGNRPWEWLRGDVRTELPFSHVGKNGGEEILVRGFIDLVRFGSDGKPDLFVDYKTGRTPDAGSEEDDKHREQLLLYAEALAATHGAQIARMTLINYYVTSKEARSRPPHPTS